MIIQHFTAAADAASDAPSLMSPMLNINLPLADDVVFYPHSIRTLFSPVSPNDRQTDRIPPSHSSK